MENTADTKRIVEEMDQLKSSKLITIKKAERIGSNDLAWKIVFDGPEETPYEDGIFTLKLIFPKNYPKEGPEAFFITKMFHPNIRESDQHVCINILNYWDSRTTVEFIIFGIFEIILDPRWEGGYPDNKSTKLLKENNDAYYDQVEEYVYNYAQKEL
jgi:ubiquitin-protein ligase